MKEVTLRVQGMHCQNCVDKIERFVGEIDGVKLINVDLKAQFVRIEYNLPANENVIKEAILDAGFEVL